MKSVNGDTLPEASRIVFATKDTGWFVKSLYPAKLYKTIDGGKTWSLQKDSVNSLHQITVASNLHISYSTAIDNYWYSFSSTDGGITWDSAGVKNYKGSEAYLLTYIDTNRLLWCGFGYPYLYSRSNKIWIRQDTTVFFSVPSDVHFINDSVGWISMMSNPHGATEAGSIVKTINGGRNWSYQGDENYPPPYFGLLTSVYFSDSSVGYAVSTNPFFAVSKIYRTIDGGVSWSDTSIYPIGSFYDLLVLGSDKLLIPSDNGVIWISKDRGQSFYKVETGLNVPLKQIQHVGTESIAYILGEKNTLLKLDLTPLLTSAKDDDELPTKVDKFVLLSNYPNPFNPSTTISYSIPELSFVTLKVYNILGKEVATIVNEQTASGSYAKTFNASNLSSGSYIYRLNAGSYSESKRTLLIK